VVTAETVKTREDSLKLVKTRVDAGLASPLDGYQAEGLLASAEAQLAEQRRLRALAEHQLALITGDPTLKIAAGDLKQLPLLPEPPAGLPSDLIEGRPDVRQAEQELVAANAGIGWPRPVISRNSR
jgi:multidrug efflux system outer membrane protein